MAFILEVKNKTDFKISKKNLLEILKILEKKIAGGGALAVVFVDGSESKKINKAYRRKNKATDILSFPTRDGASFPGGARGELGDIFICPALAKKKFGNAWKERVNYLFLHGVLHLLGYDHKTGEEALKMEKLEKQILDPISSDKVESPRQSRDSF